MQDAAAGAGNGSAVVQQFVLVHANIEGKLWIHHPEARIDVNRHAPGGSPLENTCSGAIVRVRGCIRRVHAYLASRQITNHLLRAAVVSQRVTAIACLR